jgi:hypothetical protein
MIRFPRSDLDKGLGVLWKASLPVRPLTALSLAGRGTELWKDFEARGLITIFCTPQYNVQL